ncbi:MAG TPA: carboxyl transferase domain-containing protein [Streptosporangiaceae bacterium]|nr:carboxyl transferase domain-containing protein [Streptosporangiaceae bacterium]
MTVTDSLAATQLRTAAGNGKSAVAVPRSAPPVTPSTARAVPATLSSAPAAQAAAAQATAALAHAGPGRDPQSRLEALFDPGTLELLQPADESGMLAGTGTIDGVTTVAFASDPRFQGGAMGIAGCEIIVGCYDYAVEIGAPIIGLWHSGGARILEGVQSLHAVGMVFAAMTRASGKVPQISVVLGAAAGGAAYGPALTDLVILSEQGRIFVTGPDVVRSVTGEDVDMERLGGPEPHSRRSGVVHIVTATDGEAIDRARQLVLLLGHRVTAGAGYLPDTDLGALLPDSPKRAYDVHPLISGLLDGPGIELHPRWAPNIVTTLGRFGGRTVGVIANNPLRLGGCLDATSAEKAARFVRMCDAFGVPLVVLVDVPGYLPGVGQEWDGVVRRGAKLLHAFAEAVVPRVTLVTRKAYGGAYIAMNSRALGATRVFAWPGAEVAVMGSVAAVRILHRRALAAASAEERHEVEAQLAAEHDQIVGGLPRAVALGVIDEVIEPEKTRQAILEAIVHAPSERGRHGNIPL